MNKEIFDTIWQTLYTWSLKTKRLYELGIDSSRYDKDMYNIVMLMMSLHFNQEQVDMIIWSVFDDTRELVVDDATVTIDNADACWEYINKLK